MLIDSAFIIPYENALAIDLYHLRDEGRLTFMWVSEILRLEARRFDNPLNI